MDAETPTLTRRIGLVAYMGYKPCYSDDEIRARYRARYGAEPVLFERMSAVVLCGPVPDANNSQQSPTIPIAQEGDNPL